MRRLGGDRVEAMRLARSLSILSVCVFAMSGLAGHLNSAAAQQPEKRIALVVGNAAYAKSPLATAANDAGLIAQTLQAAGFDVIGARDLDGDTLRKSFRDFINKAEASGPDTVAAMTGSASSSAATISSGDPSLVRTVSTTVSSPASSAASAISM